MSRIWVVVLAGCGTSTAAPSPDVTVEVASVTLGEECQGGGLPAPAPLPAKEAESSKQDSNRKRSADDFADSGCTQTSLQLVVKATDKAKPTTIKLKKIELVDPKVKGKVQVMLARSPNKWTGKKYEAWNQSIGPSETLQTSYTLSTPDWVTLAGGSRAAAGRTFQVRVTITVGTKDQTFEKTAIAPAHVTAPIET